MELPLIHSGGRNSPLTDISVRLDNQFNVKELIGSKGDLFREVRTNTPISKIITFSESEKFIKSYVTEFRSWRGLASTAESGKNFFSEVIKGSSGYILVLTELSSAESGDMISANQMSPNEKIISAISHTLKSPFASIIGFADILLNDEELPESRKKEFLEYIKSSAGSQLEYITNLLEWSRIKAGRKSFNLTTLNLHGLLINNAAAVSKIASEKNLELEMNVEEDSRIFSDEEMLNKVIKIIFNNAIKYSGPGEKITVNTSKEGEKLARVSITDSGCGMSETELDKIFDLDQRLCKAGTKGEKGNGFALILAREIIANLGGELTAESMTGRGSTFSFTVPLASGKIIAVPGGDEITNIRNEGYREYDIISASDLKSIIKVIKKSFPECIFVNSGRVKEAEDLVRRIREDSVIKGLPVYIV